MKMSIAKKIVEKELFAKEIRQRRFRIFRYAFYFSLFFITFGRFLPAYNPPFFVSNFFCSATIFYLAAFFSFCIFFLRIIKASYYSWRNWDKNKAFLLRAMIPLAFYIFLLLLIPTFQNLQNNFVVWINQNREIRDVINPTLGMNMYKFPADENENAEEVLFISFELRSVDGAITFTPNGNDKSRWTEEYNVIKKYNNNWRLIQRKNNFVGDATFTIE